MPTLRGQRTPPSVPLWTPPAGSVDAHVHLFGPFHKFPLAAAREYSPPAATLEEYREVQRTIGFDRAVLVQGSACGTDNRILLDAIARGDGRFRGVALVHPGVGDEELRQLAAGGICGVRLSTFLRPGLAMDHLLRTAQRLQPLGWHVELHFARLAELLPYVPVIEKLPVRAVIDHLGSVTVDEGPRAPGFVRLLELLRDTGHVWVKVSGFYRRSRLGPPYEDYRPLVEAVVAQRPDRIVWGTNWPHPLWDGPLPNDGELVDIFPKWVPDATLQRQILVDNPQQLFDFPAGSVTSAGRGAHGLTSR